MKVWITKYALTSGIIECEADVCLDSKTDMIERTDTGRGGEYYHNDEWHTSEFLAKARAEEMRVKKVASLKKQIAKLEAMKF